jgi:hypothetical protein
MPRIKRDRVAFTCPNCETRAYSRPSNQLVCGICFLVLQPQIPDFYPKAYEAPKPNTPRINPLELRLSDLALPPIIQQKLDKLNSTPPPNPPAAVVRQPKRTRNRTPELESAADHCRRWLDYYEAELDGLKPKPRIQRYLDALAAVDDLVFQVRGWNAAVAPLFGVSRQAVDQAKTAWIDSQGVVA